MNARRIVHAFLLLLCSYVVNDSNLNAAPRYNVLWIVVDDLNADVGCYGQPIVSTPNLDRLSTRGVRFDRAYAQYALCNPSRSSFISGYMPDRTRVLEQNGTARDALPDATFLPQLFRKAGYTTIGAGKIHHGSGKNVDRASWDSYEDAEGTNEQQRAAEKDRRGNPDRSPQWAAIDGDGRDTNDGVNTATIASLIEEKSSKDKPFFLALGLHKPHVPWTAPRRLFELYPPAQMPNREWLVGRDMPEVALETEWPRGTRSDKPQEALAAYLACVSFTDANVGTIMTQLDRLKLWDNTIVVFMSDHGFHLGDHGLWSKKTLFEQSLHVPLIVVHPDGRNAGRTCRRTVELLDVYPTLAELCGLTAPSDMEGRSLRPLLDDPDAKWDRPARSVVMHGESMGRSLRSERWRYTEWDQGRTGTELYDHDLDPLELTNLASKSELAEVVQQFSSKLRADR
jgi:uncharacterized sulfatase